MDEFLGLDGETTESVNLFLDEVFYGFHVVVGRLLYLLHAGSILLGKVTIDVAQRLKQLMVKSLQLGQGQFAQGDEILYLHPYTITHQCIF